MPTFIDSDFGPISLDPNEVQPVSLAIFNPAIKATLRPNGTPGIVLAIKDHSLLVVDGEGQLFWVDITQVQLDWRYNFKKDDWEDTSGESLGANDLE